MLDGNWLILIILLLLVEICIMIFLLLMMFLLYLFINFLWVDGWWKLVVMRIWICVLGVIDCNCCNRIGVIICEGIGCVWLELIIIILCFLWVSFFSLLELIGLFSDFLIVFCFDNLLWYVVVCDINLLV